MRVFGTVAVPLGSRAYDIVVGDGVLREADKYLGPVLSGPRVAVVTDETVAELHLPALRTVLESAGIETMEIVLPPGERTKSFDALIGLLDRLLEARIERGDAVLALGGGVIGDLAGFAASILRRGIKVIQLPTTLLAQVDAAIGGKTGINTRQGKNLIGTFHQPSLVLSDTALLTTLPRRELLAGYAEVVKYGLLGDAAFFGWLEENGGKVIAGDVAARNYAVLTSARTKAEIVTADELEAGRRALLNLGHTFGHAIEAELGYASSMLHGEAVAIGLGLAFELSQRLGLCPEEDTWRVRAHLDAVGLPAAPAAGAAPPQGWDPARLLDRMRQDKKVKGDTLTFILVKGIGRGFVSRDVAEDDVVRLLEVESAI